MEHLLKIKAQYFKSVLSGDKTFEIRKSDRVFSVNDRLVLFEIGDDGGETGASVAVRVTYLLNGPCYGLADGYCAMAVKRCGRQNRSNSGNRPKDLSEVNDYATEISKSGKSAADFFSYYEMTGWKMKNGLPLADWKAAFRRWKDYGIQDTDIDAEKVRLLLPLLLREIAMVSDKRQELEFSDTSIGTVVQYFGLRRLHDPLGTFDVGNMLKIYLEARRLGTGIKKMGASPYGKGISKVPTLDEYELLTKSKKN